MQSPQGKTSWSTGTYEQIIPQQKIICTDQFADEKGNIISAFEAGMNGKWPEKLYLTIEFEPCNRDQTKLVVTHQGIPKSQYDDCCDGWISSIDKLKKLVEQNA